MSARLNQAISWIATILAFAVGALVLAVSIVALAMFAFGVHHLASQMGLANWSSLGVGALFVALLGGIWLMGNSFARHHRRERFSPLRNKAESAH